MDTYSASLMIPVSTVRTRRVHLDPGSRFHRCNLRTWYCWKLGPEVKLGKRHSCHVLAINTESTVNGGLALGYSYHTQPDPAVEQWWNLEDWVVLSEFPSLIPILMGPFGLPLPGFPSPSLQEWRTAKGAKANPNNTIRATATASKVKFILKFAQQGGYKIAYFPTDISSSIYKQGKSKSHVKRMAVSPCTARQKHSQQLGTSRSKIWNKYCCLASKAKLGCQFLEWTRPPTLVQRCYAVLIFISVIKHWFGVPLEACSGGSWAWIGLFPL